VRRRPRVSDAMHKHTHMTDQGTDIVHFKLHLPRKYAQETRRVTGSNLVLDPEHPHFLRGSPDPCRQAE
jgi:hypothetical protein